MFGWTGENTTTLVLGLVLAVSGALAGGVWLGGRRARAEIQHTDADTDRIEAETDFNMARSAREILAAASELIAPLRAQIAANEKSNAALHERVDDLEAHVAELERMLSAAGIDPPPRPARHRTTTIPTGGH